jgi:hypothetical protein
MKTACPTSWMAVDSAGIGVMLPGGLGWRMEGWDPR